MDTNRKLGQRTRVASAVSATLSQTSGPRSAVLGLMLGGAVIGTTVHAQETDTSATPNNQIEEVVVTGIRGSLQRAVDIKKNASGIVDAISAEDIGVFPDTNLAESLQRITGVSIDRNLGEGSEVTVRGFGPEFNLVTLNGRQMPTHNGVTRSFDFADLASEGVAGVQVYKTGNADVPTGGIGSTINIITTKPLDAPGLKSVVSVKGVHDTSTDEGSDLTPEISGIYSNTFADDTIGISISASYQERDNGLNNGTTGGYRTFPGIVDNEWGSANTVQEWGGIPRNDQQINRPDNNSIYSVPQSAGYQFNEYSRERLNGQLTLQWQASDNVRATLDYTYAEYDLERTFNNYSAWYNFGGQVTEYSDGPVASPLVYTEFPGGSDFAMAAGRDGSTNENNSLGFNVEWDVNDRLSLEFDWHDSSAESAPNSQNGSASQLAIASFTRERTTTFFGGDLPILNIGLSRPLSAQDMIVTGSVFENELSDMNIQQTTLRGNFEFDDRTDIDFGVQLSEVDNRSALAVVQRNDWGGTTQPGDIADLLTPASSAGQLDQISNGNDPRRQLDYFTYDLDALIARTEALGATNSTAGDCGTGLCISSNFTTDRRTVEDSTAVYVQLNADREVGNVPVNIKAGLRYEETDVVSQALVPTYATINQTGMNEFDAVQAVDASGQPIQDFTRLEGKYDFVLPNLDIRANFTDNLIARFSFSETITRPSYEDIQGGLTIDSLLRVDGGTGSRGNPELLPFESQNIDLSLEYYFDDTDYASIGYFHKDVKNFIGTSIIQDEVLFPALIQPNTGQPALFDVTVPINQEEATLDGWELAIQKTFGETGFGVQANATLVDGDVEFDNFVLDQQFVVPGLSDSANLVGFYATDKLQVRLAYNWRDDFLSGVGQATGQPGPTYVEAFGQWDISARYNLNENLTVFIEGINITEETFRVYGRSKLETLEAGQTGARYNIGFRYEF